MAKTWTFEQQGGDRKSLSLDGASAPHGRPRQSPVVSDGVKLRRQRTQYPDAGRNSPPTTHIFGVEFAPWELTGRFSDRHLGKGATKKTIEAWQDFVIDAQPVRISWGDIVAAEGFIDEFVPGRESEAEASYKITISIDRPDQTVRQQRKDEGQTPAKQCFDLSKEFSEGLGGIPQLPVATQIQPTFLESLEDAVSEINKISAGMLDIAGQLDSFATGSIDQLERLRAGVGQFRTAVLKLGNTFANATNDLALLSESADNEVQWATARMQATVSELRILALLADIDRTAEIAQVGLVGASYTARLGDTWESIATIQYGGPDGAGSIRDANGARYGELPTPGRTYQIPTR